MGTKIRSIPAGQFKARCLALLDDVAETGRPVLVTKRGRPVARVVPAKVVSRPSLKGSIRSEKDIVAPLGIRWNAEK